VQGHAGDDHVEGLVVERQLAGVAIAQLDPLGDPLGLGVGQRRGRVVPGLVLLAPQVQPDRLADGATLGRPDQQQPAAAANVQDPLVTSPGQLVQEPVALDELAGPAAADHEPGLGDGDQAQTANQPPTTTAGTRWRRRKAAQPIPAPARAAAPATALPTTTPGASRP
jgi:hypothetical protein